VCSSTEGQAENLPEGVGVEEQQDQEEMGREGKGQERPPSSLLCSLEERL
jgi:hypothetical protein